MERSIAETGKPSGTRLAIGSAVQIECCPQCSLGIDHILLLKGLLPLPSIENYSMLNQLDVHVLKKVSLIGMGYADVYFWALASALLIVPVSCKVL